MDKLFKWLTAPSKPGEKSFDELKQLKLYLQNTHPNWIAKCLIGIHSMQG